MSNQRIYINANSAADGKSSDSYGTPSWLFDYLNDEYDFACDAAASDENHLCEMYYTKENDAINKNWSESGGAIFVNPPFSNGEKEKFLAKAYQELVDSDVTSVFVIPADPSNKCWLDHIFGKATKITIINGRVKFTDPKTGLESKTGLGAAIIEFQCDEPPVFHMGYIERDKIKK